MIPELQSPHPNQSQIRMQILSALQNKGRCRTLTLCQKQTRRRARSPILNLNQVLQRNMTLTRTRMYSLPKMKQMQTPSLSLSQNLLPNWQLAGKQNMRTATNQFLSLSLILNPRNLNNRSFQIHLRLELQKQRSHRFLH